jgi:hypothetical protein
LIVLTDTPLTSPAGTVLRPGGLLTIVPNKMGAANAFALPPPFQSFDGSERLKLGSTRRQMAFIGRWRIWAFLDRSDRHAPHFTGRNSPGGRCAVLRVVGHADSLEPAALYLYREWLPASGEEDPIIGRWRGAGVRVKDVEGRTDLQRQARRLAPGDAPDWAPWLAAFGPLDKARSTYMQNAYTPDDVTIRGTDRSDNRPVAWCGGPSERC